MRLPRLTRAYPPHIGPTVTLRDPALASYLTYASNEAGQNVTETTALGLTAVYRCVSIIASTVAGLPLKSFRDGPDGVRTPAESVWDDPGAGMWTRYEFVHLCMVHLALHGNAFLLHVYGGGGQLVGFFPVHPSAVTVKHDKDTGGRLFHVSLDGETRIYDEREMTQVMLFSLDGLTGSSPIRLARNAIGTGLAGDKAAASMFASGLMVSGLVTSDETLTEEDAKLVKAGLDAKLTGAGNAGSLAFVNRSLKISPWTMTSEDAQFIESRQFQITEVARIFGVPKTLLAEDGASTWGSGINELLNAFQKFTLRSSTTPFEQRAMSVTPPLTVEFDYAGLLQGTPKDEIELLAAQITAGILTINEARAIRNLPPVPGGDAPPPPEPSSPAPADNPPKE